MGFVAGLVVAVGLEVGFAVGAAVGLVVDAKLFGFAVAEGFAAPAPLPEDGLPAGIVAGAGLRCRHDGLRLHPAP